MPPILHEFSSFFPTTTSLAKRYNKALTLGVTICLQPFLSFQSENYYNEILDVIVMPVLHNYLELKLWRAEIT